MGDTQKYGQRNVPKMIRQIDTLRQLIRREGTPQTPLALA